MKIDIVSAIPESIEGYLNYSIIKNAREKGLIQVDLHNLHEYAANKWRRIDDYPFGGDAGMVIQCEPVFNCIEKLKSINVYDEIANELSLKNNLLLLAGHYKGIDQRIRDTLITREISIGDYVLTGGELPALILLDAIVRLLPGVIGDATSALNDSFQDGLLEAPIYTRPSVYRGMEVPKVLLSGNHKEIEEWKFKLALEKTKKFRPDMLKDGF